MTCVCQPKRGGPVENYQSRTQSRKHTCTHTNTHTWSGPPVATYLPRSMVMWQLAFLMGEGAGGMVALSGRTNPQTTQTMTLDDVRIHAHFQENIRDMSSVRRVTVGVWVSAQWAALKCSKRMNPRMSAVLMFATHIYLICWSTGAQRNGCLNNNSQRCPVMYICTWCKEMRIPKKLMLPSEFKSRTRSKLMLYLSSKAAHHHVSEQFGSKHGETGAQHMGYYGQCKACRQRSQH